MMTLQSYQLTVFICLDNVSVSPWARHFLAQLSKNFKLDQDNQKAAPQRLIKSLMSRMSPLL